MISFPVSTIPEEAQFGIRVSGVSMLPRYVDRQIAWVEQCDELYNGEIGVFFYDDKAYIKKYIEEMLGKYKKLTGTVEFIDPLYRHIRIDDTEIGISDINNLTHRDWNDDEEYHVVAWMPLPPLYKQ